MRYTELISARDKLLLSRLIFGTGSLGSSICYENAAILLDYYRAKGGTAIDTARMYGNGASEETIGRYLTLSGCRNHIILSTKGGFPPKEDMHHSRIRPDELLRDLEDSLRALRTSHTDIYFLHRDDPGYPLSELMPFLHKLVSSGKVRFLGASNWSAARISQANEFAALHNLTPFSISQIQWSLAEATPAMWADDTIICMNEKEAAFYTETRMPVMAFTPLTRGFFSKAIQAGIDSPDMDSFAAFKTPLNLLRIQRLQVLCEKYCTTPSQLCHAYLTNHLICGLAVLGAKNLSHLADSLAGSDLILTPEDITFLSAGM